MQIFHDRNLVRHQEDELEEARTIVHYEAERVVFFDFVTLHCCQLDLVSCLRFGDSLEWLRHVSELFDLKEERCRQRTVKGIWVFACSAIKRCRFKAQLFNWRPIDEVNDFRRLQLFILVESVFLILVRFEVGHLGAEPLPDEGRQVLDELLVLLLIGLLLLTG